VSPLFPKDYWQKYGRKENSKNPAKDEKKQRVEKVSTKNEKVKSSTQNKGESPKSPKSPTKIGEIGEIGESHSNSVDDSKKSKSRETEKNRISAEEPIAQETVVGKDWRYKVVISVYRVGEEEKVIGDKIVKRTKLKFELRYGSLVLDCVDDCRDTISKIAKSTNYNVSKKAISGKIAELREKYSEEEEMPLIDFVRQKYPDRLNEIEKDPIGWIMTRTKEIVGYDRLKLLTFLSLVSTRMERVMGMSRIHIMLVGGSGVGKSSTVKSVLKFAEDIVIPSTRITQNALGYLNVDSFDGHALFIEQIDRQNMNYLRELMTEEKICTVVTEKGTDENGNERLVARQRCIEGQPVVITTSVVDTIDVEREQIFNRMLKVYVKADESTEGVIWKSIMDRSKVEISPVDAMVFKAWLLTRPSYAKIPEDVTNAVIDFMKKLKEYTREPLNRTVEIARNLIIVTAIMRGRTEATLDDWQFVAENFQLDLLYNGLGLTERDVEIIEALPDTGGLKSSEVADALKISKQYTINLLKNLERKGVVEGDKTDGKTFTWSLTALGRRIKALVNNLDKDVVEVRDEKGELVGVADSKFRDDTNVGNDRKDAVPGNDGDAMSRGDDKTNRVIEAYNYLKTHGWVLLTDVEALFGEDIVEKLKRKDLVTFNVVDGVEYVTAK
jgi:DNA-binding MarR family transcriptional regulator